MTLSGPPRDPVGTGFGRGFLSPSCPALATTPVPSTPSAKPRPARLFFLSPPFPPPPLHQMHQPATFSKVVSEPNPADLSTYAHPLRPTVARALSRLSPSRSDAKRTQISPTARPIATIIRNPLAVD